MMRSLLLVPILLAASCGSSTTTYVGAVQGTDVAVGLVTDGSHTALFFCGGPSSFATSTKWLRFARSGDTFDQSNGAWKVAGALDGASASGTVDRGDGQALSWSATRVDDGSPEGLYESVSGSGTGGVVVRGPSDAQGAFTDPQQKITQIIPIFPLDLEPQGLRVSIGGASAFVPRATPE